jgi:hypothetical protein
VINQDTPSTTLDHSSRYHKVIATVLGDRDATERRIAHQGN